MADFNADSKLDFAAVSDYGNYLSVQMGNGDGTFGGGYSNFGSGAPSSVVAADLNSDGKVDLATASSDSVRVFLGDGLGSFSSPQSYGYPQARTQSSWPRLISIATAAMDLITANTSGTLSVLLGTGTGVFQPPVSTAVVSTPSMLVVGLAVGDFNRDGWMDATYANYASNNVSVLLNDGVWPAPGSPSISINDETLTEGNTGTRAAAFTVTLSSASSQAGHGLLFHRQRQRHRWSRLPVRDRYPDLRPRRDEQDHHRRWSTATGSASRTRRSSSI